jgi:hypothetical protein
LFISRDLLQSSAVPRPLARCLDLYPALPSNDGHADRWATCDPDVRWPVSIWRKLTAVDVNWYSICHWGVSKSWQKVGRGLCGNKPLSTYRPPMSLKVNMAPRNNVSADADTTSAVRADQELTKSGINLPAIGQEGAADEIGPRSVFVL